MFAAFLISILLSCARNYIPADEISAGFKERSGRLYLYNSEKKSYWSSDSLPEITVWSIMDTKGREVQVKKLTVYLDEVWQEYEQYQLAPNKFSRWYDKDSNAYVCKNCIILQSKDVYVTR